MHSLRQQLTLGLLGVFAVLLGIGGAAIYGAMRTSLYRQFDAVLQDKAQVVMSHVRQQDGRVLVYFSDFFLSAFDETGASGYFQVYNAEGRSVVRSSSLGVASLPLLPTSEAGPIYRDGVLPGGEAGRFIAIRFEPLIENLLRGHEPTTATIIAAAHRQPLEETLAALRWILIGTGLLVLAASALAVRQVLRRSLRPVHQAARDAAEITAETLDRRLMVNTLPSELHPLTEKFNDLLARLEASFERERRFSSDLAHELRTPLAELRSIAEVALKWPEDRDNMVDANVLEIAIQLESRVETLLALASAEQDAARQPLRETTLREEVRRHLRPLQARFASRQIVVQVALSEEHDDTVRIDPVLFPSILGNLLENAASYAPAGSTVNISIGTTADRFALVVGNPAPQLDATDLERLFDRFWRKDPARADTAHAGLGLSLARSYAGLLGMRLDASLDADHILHLRINGPR